jgi:hypothetical protein
LISTRVRRVVRAQGWTWLMTSFLPVMTQSRHASTGEL